MNESELDTKDAREPPDYKVASLLMWIAQGATFARRIGIDFEVYERLIMLADEAAAAISVRGARVGELVDALREVRRHGSIFDDLPTKRPPGKQSKASPSWWRRVAKNPFR